MKIAGLTIDGYLSQAEYIIPAYQRPFQWTDDLLEGLWSDLGEMYTGGNKKNHYIGVLLSHAETQPADLLRGPASAGHGRTVWSLVDGQQRLVTVLLLIAAIRDSSSGATAASARRLTTATESDRPRLVGQEEDRVLLTRILTTDRPTLTAAEQKSRVGNAYQFFLRQLNAGKKSFWQPVGPKTTPRAATGTAAIKTGPLLKVVTQGQVPGSGVALRSFLGFRR